MKFFRIIVWLTLSVLLGTIALSPVLDDLLEITEEVKQDVVSRNAVLDALDSTNIERSSDPTGPSTDAAIFRTFKDPKVRAWAGGSSIFAAATAIAFAVRNRRQHNKKVHKREPRLRKLRPLYRPPVQLTEVEGIGPVGLLATPHPLRGKPPVAPRPEAPRPEAHQLATTSRDRSLITAPVAAANSPGEIENTSRGVPAAAQSRS